ncbi:3374_t:CDS:2, partial [Paraglomus occultum]
MYSICLYLNTAATEVNGAKNLCRLSIATVIMVSNSSTNSSHCLQQQQNHKKKDSSAATRSKTSFRLDKDKLKGKDGLVKINFPAEDLRDIGVRQAIHDAFKAERIGLSSGMVEARRRFIAGFEIPLRAKIKVANYRDLRLDVGMWYQRPSRVQRCRPIIHPCPPPNVWIE